jgi:flagellar basal body rod protein FlgC
MNAQTTKTAEGGPYQRKYLDVTDGQAEIHEKNTGNRFVYDPIHPDAITRGDYRGYVEMPNVDIVLEMTNYIFALLFFEEVAREGINKKIIDENAFEELMERINNASLTIMNIINATHNDSVSQY